MNYLTPEARAKAERIEAALDTQEVAILRQERDRAIETRENANAVTLRVEAERDRYRNALAAVDEPRIRADERQKVVLEYARDAEPKVAAAVRADQTQRIVEWLRARDAEQRKRGLVEHNSPGLVADILAREFGNEGGPR